MPLSTTSNNPTETARRTSSWRRLLVVWVGLFVLLDLAVAAEVMLRLRARADEKRMAEFARSNVFVQGADNALDHNLWAKRWQRYRPHARLEFEADNGERFVVSINSHGFRGPEFSVPKPPGTFRIACIGASTTVQGRRDDTTYPAHLEAALRERFPGLAVEVLNLGVSGTLSDHWVERLGQLDSFEPDVVIQYNGANDIVQKYFKEFAARHATRAALHRRSRLASRLLPVDPRDFEGSFAETLGHFAALREHVQSRGGIYVGATFAGPDYGAADRQTRQYLDYVSKLWSQGHILGYRQYRPLLDELNRRLREQAESDVYPLVDVAAALTQPRLFTDLCHMDAQGIRRLAELFLPIASAAVESRFGRAPDADQAWQPAAPQP